MLATNSKYHSERVTYNVTVNYRYYTPYYSGIYYLGVNQNDRYRWFSWGVASLPEGKTRGLCLAHLCANTG